MLEMRIATAIHLFEFRICPKIVYLLLYTLERYKQSIVISDWRKRNSIFGKNGTERNVLQQHLNDSLHFFCLRIQIENKTEKKNIIILSSLYIEWLDNIGPSKALNNWIVPLHSEFILNNENFIRPTERKIKQFVWRTMKQMITLAK